MLGDLRRETSVSVSTVINVSWVLGAVLFATVGPANPAPTAEMAKKCRQMMVKAYPPLPPGSKQGDAQQQQEYFRRCLAQGGKQDNTATPTEGRGE
jgi:hypothetical protein